MKTHYLKVWTKQFDAVRRGAKTHEVRKGDRDYRAGDIVILREFDPNERRYTGKCMEVQITFITRGGTFGIPDDICVMSIRRVNPAIDFEELVEDMPPERRPFFMREGYNNKQYNDDDDVDIDVDEGEEDEGEGEDEDNLGNK